MWSGKKESYTYTFGEIKSLKKSTLELMAMCNSESKSISTRKTRREVEELELNSHEGLCKPLISEAN